jgi:hypothetical protein
MPLDQSWRRWHASIDLGRTVPISDLIREVKGESSKWMKRDMGVSDFSWQAGYGAFSVCASQRDQVAEYIAKQKEHHAKQSFQDEYRAFLQRYEIDYDERYVWD